MHPLSIEPAYLVQLMAGPIAALVAHRTGKVGVGHQVYYGDEVLCSR